MMRESEHQDGGDDSQHSRWRKPFTIAAIAGGVAVVIGGTVAATLALTRQSAVTENFVAYANGRTEGYDHGFLAGVLAANLTVD